MAWAGPARFNQIHHSAAAGRVPQGAAWPRGASHMFDVSPPCARKGAVKLAVERAASLGLTLCELN